ncbi:hypothetical protein DMB66_13660 [Actinoplanes sp. ATCC 53533]|uniref:hypothetical protein n=1 Tax=Actinoplanes sp. ATCC 53533 TaxID=1288362 RepID=UPI000F79D118|nr:hypothetical protein [Actinoplanes sp. ATCC 53533]RSM68223.1 hypothetical protein DMB66_13660 [Actinoplanes sp. ATCC 53533]
MLPIWLAAMALGGCVGSGPDGAGPDTAGAGAAPLRGFGVDVDQAIAPRVPVVHLRTCGSWGCHEQDVTLVIAGPTSAVPCPSASAAADTACGVAHLPGPGPGFGYAPVPELTLEQVTVTVTTPAGAPLRVRADLAVRPFAVCPESASCPPSSAAVPQARLRITADGTVIQSR